MRISAILAIFAGVRVQKPPKKGHFVDAESVSKTLKTFNLTTTNAIRMKLTTIVYLHESVNRKLLRSRNSVFWCNVSEFLDYIKNHHICHALPCVESLIKFCNNSMKTSQDVKIDCYASFWRSLKLEPKLLSSRNLPGLCNLWGFSFGAKLRA